MSGDIFPFSDLENFELADPILMIVGVIFAIVALIAIAYIVAVYIFQSVGLYSIAKRRGIHHPGLAWVPVANLWILGSISDQYQYVVKGRVRNRRKVLLGLTIAVYALSLVNAVMFFVSIFSVDTMTVDPFSASLILSMGGSVVVSLAMSAVAIIAAVFIYIAYFDLFRSCNPGNAVLFLILSIFFDFLLPIFIFICRKKDEGMPPRRIQLPVEPVEAPIDPEIE